MTHPQRRLCRVHEMSLLAAFLVMAQTQVHAAPSLNCSVQAITCVQVVPSGTVDGGQPVTFGEVFKDGDVPAPAQLAAVDERGNKLPLQLDEAATYPDHSLRFAVLSTLIPDAKGEPRLVNLVHGPAAAAPPPRPPAPFALQVAVTAYTRQTSIVKFGNRNGQTPGTPFQAGEEITLHADDENFTLRTGQGMTAGDYISYQNIAKAFADLVNRQSKKFHANWSGAEAGFEEDLRLSTATDKAPFSVSVSYKGAAHIAVLPYQSAQVPERWNATLGPEEGRVWLNGPVAIERDIALPLVSVKTGKKHPLLAVHVHLRRYLATGAVRADVVLDNDWAYAPAPGNVSYDIAILRDGQPVFSRQDIIHTHHSRWHTLVWSGNYTEPVVRFNIPYLVGSGLIPHYDAALNISPRALDLDASLLEKAGTGPMETATVTPYMPTTGMRWDIGPLPLWTAQYLLSMDKRARAMMFANADAGGSMPLHYQDEATGLPVSLDRHPGLAMEFGKPQAVDAFPNVNIRVNPWTLDSAHLPSLSYVPYLVTGDLFYLEEVTFFANWVMGSVDPGLRDMGKGLLWANQVRATAWAMRTLGEAAIILPDSHPMKGYFSVRLQNNLSYYLTHFARNRSPDVSPLGILENVDQKGIIGPWQYDFFFLSVADIARAGEPQAGELARWMARFVVGRWSKEAEEKGYCHQMAPAYYVKFRGADGRPLSDWGQLFQANWPEVKSCPSQFVADSGPGTPDGYVANSYAALGAAAALGLPQAREEQARIAKESSAMLSSFQQDPTFAIVP